MKKFLILTLFLCAAVPMKSFAADFCIARSLGDDLGIQWSYEILCEGQKADYPGRSFAGEKGRKKNFALVESSMRQKGFIQVGGEWKSGPDIALFEKTERVNAGEKFCIVHDRGGGSSGQPSFTLECSADHKAVSTSDRNFADAYLTQAGYQMRFQFSDTQKFTARLYVSP